jgi:hypothetical protein
MSFELYQKPTITHKLSCCSSSASYGVNGVNIVRFLTQGLQKFYNEDASTNSNLQWSQQYRYLPRPVIRTVGDDTFEKVERPLRHYRYQFEKLIANGTFSQIFLGSDVYKNRNTIAIKLVQQGCELLALREKVFLDHLNSLQTGSLYCK